MNKDSENNKSTNQFLKKDGGKTKSNQIEIPSITLPKGGGAIKGIDEKFSVNAVNGTASFSIPLPVSEARGASPQLNLSYNSGSGNGIFGLGWNISLPSIKRKTDKKLPQYFDGIDSDTFLFSEAEDLVPEFKKDTNGNFTLDTNGDYEINEKDSPDNKYLIRYYKPRIEGLFARIERWLQKTTGEIKWRVISKENVTTLFGWSAGSRISDSNDSNKIFEWLPEFVFDDKGNCSHYIYRKENTLVIDSSSSQRKNLHNKNRFKNGAITYTNLYLEKILYGNKTPYKNFADLYPTENDFMFKTVFDYGTLKSTDPSDVLNAWDFRNDAFSEYKSGFEIRTTRLCKRVLLFHNFIELGGETLIKSLNFEYDTDTEKDFTYLKFITSFGYIKNNGSYTSKNLPPYEFDYQSHDWNKEVRTIPAESLVHAPVGLDESQYQFTDLFNEGLSGILTEQAEGWYYKHNLGNGIFEQAKLVTPKPSFSGLGSQLQLVDLDADGGKQLVNYNNEPKGYFELNDDNEWQPFKTFDFLSNINLQDSNTRMVDLNGDGIADVLITEDNVFSWYKSNGRKGIKDLNKTIKSYDEDEGPAIVFSDSTQSIYLADMSGDGMTDIVRIKNGSICYWPNLGYGRFGAKIEMDNSPLFDYPDSYNPSYLRLADIDGSGTTDIIYLGKNKFSCWMNLSGNSFSIIPFEINSFPEIHNHSKITVTDLLGNGVSCIVWSSGLQKDTNSPLRYIDLMNSMKPHIMTGYKNNLGKEVLFEYTPSTKFYIEDKLAGKPWVTKLHFPVHCISKTETMDRISGWHFVSSYKYHHGYYDHPEREFRGFGMVEQTDAETFEHWVKQDASNITEEPLHQEPIVSKSWHHTGAFLRKDKILTQFSEDYWYEEMQREGFTVTHHEVSLPDARLVVAPGMDAAILNHLSAQEWQEALRACKGMALRSETFAKDALKFGNTQDARKKELTPFSVATHNCVIELLQPKGNNKHAVFVVKENEAITYSYERNPEDPRIAHSLNIKLDEYGNVLESASVVYPRIEANIFAESLLPEETKAEQRKTVIIYTENKFTNDVLGDDTHRLPLPSEVKTYELKGVGKTQNYYSPADFRDILLDINSDTAIYHEINKPIVGSKAQKRLIEHIRTNYYRNDLTGNLPLHTLESLALPYESYQLAYTPELLTDIYGPMNDSDSKINVMLMDEGKFAHSEGDSNWWVRSGTTQFIQQNESVTNAQNRFYVPVSFIDPYGAKTEVKYYGNYFLFIEETEDALGNETKVDEFNFRTLSPQRMRDINNNLSEVITDELGLVKAMALLGKGTGTEGDDLSGLTESTDVFEASLVNQFFVAADQQDGKDLLLHATARFVYDYDAYMINNKPAVVASILREEHYQKNNNSPVQISFEYSNGLGKVVMKKVQAEPGLAKQVTVNIDGTITIDDINTTPNLRWIGNGRTVLNNKGNPVKQYEPYFSISHQYEDFKELVESGVSPVMYYDAVGRMTKTDFPDGTFSKTIFDSWKQVIYDQNDTVIESQWYDDRDSPNPTLPEPHNNTKRRSAWLAAKHANTPTEHHFDTLGRPILQIENNGKDIDGGKILYRTKAELDVEGNIRSVTDAREIEENSFKGNVVMSYKYDMLGNQVYQNSMDAGQRWFLLNILGDPLRTWDERNHEFQYSYDTLHRPLESKVIGGDGHSQLNHIFDRKIYGEGISFNEQTDKELNLRGQVYRYFDSGGLIETNEYDFKGQPKSTIRKIFKKYKEVANWSENILGTANINSLLDLEDEEYTFITETDALGRITKQTAPDKSIIVPSYNKTGLLDGETILHLNDAAATEYIREIEYNEKGQREIIEYGNNVTTEYQYDKNTFRLLSLITKRSDNSLLQELHYTYDAVGNITNIQDKAIPTHFSNNRKIEAVNEYTYDALYRLVKATGRENNSVLNITVSDNWNDALYMHQYENNDPMLIRKYIQNYIYDAVGNIIQMHHRAHGNDWSRNYEYETINNRLRNTTVGREPNSFTYDYPHHPQHGFIIRMPHLQEMGWNFKEELVKTVRQIVNEENGTPETTYYQYDGRGQRIRKITENFSAANTPDKKEERIYIAGFEIFETYDGNIVNFERQSLSLLEEEHRFVMIETVTQKNSTSSSSDTVGSRLTRYQLHNHLGSASLELDENEAVISYEEYHPYGTTAYQAMSKNLNAAAKRYRFTGMERDEESGLEYHSARYYLPWLGRWLSSDPIGIVDGLCIYRYSRCNPLVLSDVTGNQSISQSIRLTGLVTPIQIYTNSPALIPILNDRWISNRELRTQNISQHATNEDLFQFITGSNNKNSDAQKLTYNSILNSRFGGLKGVQGNNYENLKISRPLNSLPPSFNINQLNSVMNSFINAINTAPNMHPDDMQDLRGLHYLLEMIYNVPNPPGGAPLNTPIGNIIPLPNNDGIIINVQLTINDFNLIINCIDPSSKSKMGNDVNYTGLFNLANTVFNNAGVPNY